MDLSIIVLTYNAKDITINSLESLKKAKDFFESQTKLKSEVLLVDNASTDGVLDEVKKFNFVKIIPNNKNLGFAKGNNLAVKNISSDSNYVLFLNPDIILDENSIYETYVFMKTQKNVGLVTCNLLLPNGKMDIDCHRAFPTIWNAFCYFTKLEKLFGGILPWIFGRYHMLYQNFNKPHEIDACLGAFMLIDRKVGDSVSWWSEDYFLNGEDIDLCFKIKNQKGKRIYFFPGAKVVHFKGSSKGTKKVTASKINVSAKTKDLQIKSGIDAMKIFYKKFYASENPKIVNSLVYLGMKVLKFIRLITKTE